MIKKGDLDEWLKVFEGRPVRAGALMLLLLGGLVAWQFLSSWAAESGKKSAQSSVKPSTNIPSVAGTSESSRTVDEKRVIEAKRSIERVRSIYQTIDDFGEGARIEVEEKAPKLGRRMISLPDTGLDLGHRITRNHYAGFAFIMAASVTRSDSARKSYSETSIAALEAALGQILVARAEMQSLGGNHAEALVTWLDDDQMEERTLFLIAVAQAILGTDGHMDASEARSTLEKLANKFPAYFERYPASSNDFLSWALG